jgi:hypothetical protein
MFAASMRQTMLPGPRWGVGIVLTKRGRSVEVSIRARWIFWEGRVERHFAGESWLVQSPLSEGHHWKVENSATPCPSLLFSSSLPSFAVRYGLYPYDRTSCEELGDFRPMKLQIYERIVLTWALACNIKYQYKL